MFRFPGAQLSAVSEFMCIPIGSIVGPVLGLLYRILHTNHKKALRWSLCVEGFHFFWASAGRQAAGAQKDFRLELGCLIKL